MRFSAIRPPGPHYQEAPARGHLIAADIAMASMSATRTVMVSRWSRRLGRNLTDLHSPRRPAPLEIVNNDYKSSVAASRLADETAELTPNRHHGALRSLPLRILNKAGHRLSSPKARIRVHEDARTARKTRAESPNPCAACSAAVQCPFEGCAAAVTIFPTSGPNQRDRQLLRRAKNGTVVRASYATTARESASRTATGWRTRRQRGTVLITSVGRRTAGEEQRRDRGCVVVVPTR